MSMREDVSRGATVDVMPFVYDKYVRMHVPIPCPFPPSPVCDMPPCILCSHLHQAWDPHCVFVVGMCQEAFFSFVLFLAEGDMILQGFTFVVVDLSVIFLSLTFSTSRFVQEPPCSGNAAHPSTSPYHMLFFSFFF